MEIKIEEPLLEMDVCLLHPPHATYVTQSPLRPYWEPYCACGRQPQGSAGPGPQVAALRIKPLQRKLEIDLRVGKDGGGAGDGEEEAPPCPMLSSALALPRAVYATARLLRGRVVLTPLHASMQLRPSFVHIDRAAAAEAAAAAAAAKQTSPDGGAADADADDLMRDEGEDDAFRLVDVTIRRRETARAAVARARAHSRPRQVEDQEEWRNVRLVVPETAGAAVTAATAAAVAADVRGADVPDVDGMPPLDYLELINPQPKAVVQQAPTTVVGKHQLSREHLRTLSLEDQLRALLTNAHCIKFSRICELASAGRGDHARVLRGLLTIAVLVRGCWCVRSNLVYEGRAAVASDYLLYRLHKDGFVTRKEFAEKAGVPGDVALGILSQVAVLTSGRGWAFKLDRDDEFIEANPAVVSAQARQWESRHATTMDKLSRKPADEGEQTSERSRQRAAPAPLWTSSAEPTRATFGSNAYRGSDVESQLRSFLQVVFAHRGVVTPQTLREQLQLRARETNPNNLLVGGGVPPQLLQRLLGEESIVVRGRYVARSAPSEEVNRFRNVILQLFEESEGVRRNDVARALGDGVSMPGPVYSRIMRELAVSRGGTWTLKPGS